MIQCDVDQLRNVLHHMEVVRYKVKIKCLFMSLAFRALSGYPSAGSCTISQNKRCNASVGTGAGVRSGLGSGVSGEMQVWARLVR
jgi:hypothetical protein